ncbi:MAG: hypothetical protein FWF12_03595 [Betaproteobacteria bacterium]|nr:hypothetical protein [Betaproteobacteria bacterium]
MTTRACGLLLSVMVSFAFCATSFAQDSSVAGIPLSAERKTNYFSVATEISNYRYTEPMMKLTGTMVGFSAEYLNNGGVGYIRKSTPIQLRARLNYMYGELDYNGRNQLGTPVKTSGESHYFVDMVFAGGLGFKIMEGFSISPYFGFGYRYLVDKDDGNTGDYKREQTYYYLPIGADWRTSLTRGWKITVNAELDFLLRGENTTDLTKYGEGKLNFRQNTGYGFRSSVKVEKDLKSLGIFAEPFFRHWDIKRSDTVDNWYEPKNKTQEFGLKIGVSF